MQNEFTFSFYSLGLNTTKAREKILSVVAVTAASEFSFHTATSRGRSGFPGQLILRGKKMNWKLAKYVAGH